MGIELVPLLHGPDPAQAADRSRGSWTASQGLQFPMTIYVAPRFETGDERYAWLNRIQAVGKGILNQDLSLEYEWYEVR